MNRSWSIDDIESDRVHELPHDLQDFVDDTSSLICVDMGSMAEVGIGGTVDWLIFAAALVQAVASIRLDRPQGTSGFVCRLLLLHFPHEVTVAALRTYLDDAAAAATTPGESPTTRGVKRPRPVETAEEGETPSSFSWVRILPPEAFLPHAALFPRCRAVVHHGGLGTTVACLRYVRVG